MSSGFCVPVDIEVQQDTFTVNGLAVGLAFFFGFLFGLILLLICAKLCLKDFAKKKRQDAEETFMAEQGLAAHEKGKIDYLDSRQNTTVSVQSQSSKKRTHFGKKKKGDQEPLVPIIPITLIDSNSAKENENQIENGDDVEGGKKSKGLIDALVQQTPSAMEVEMVEQDVDSVNELERELKEEAIMTMIQLMRTLLNQQMNKGKLTQEQYKEVMKEAQQNIQDVVKQTQDEKEEEEDEVKKKFKDPTKRQEEIDKLHGKYVNKMNSLLGDEREKMRKELGAKTDMSEAEIEAILAMYAKQMANLQHKLGVERARQAASLEERLAMRKQLASLHNLETQIQVSTADHQRDTNDKMTKHLVDNGKLTDKQKEELLKQYNEDVNRLTAAEQSEYERQKLSLADKLRRNREEKTRRLKAQQEKDQEKFLKDSEMMPGSGDVVDAYHSLLQHQREMRDQLSDELDNIEAQQILQLKKGQEEKQRDILMEAEDTFNKALKGRGITDAELDRLMKIHQQEIYEFERIKKEDRMRSKAKLEEKLAKRRLQAEEEQTLAMAEAQAVKDQQDATIDKVLNSQVELTPEDREKIMKEYEQNMTAVNNQLQMSKLRQKKVLEAKMAARKAKVDDLRQKQEDVRKNRQHLKEKEKEKLSAQLEAQIRQEEARLNEERKKAINEHRRVLSQETEAALADQEKQLGLVIARLQVGQARRQAIINKQDKAIKELEKKLAQKVDGSGDGSSNQNVDYLLQEHYRQVTDLNLQMQDVKDRQDQVLREKLEVKKLQKEREVEDKLEAEAQEEWREQKKRGALVSTSILSQMMLENRHKNEIKRLEKEMEIEMQKQREKLNDQLEKELQQELQERKKSFLAKVAAVNNMSREEVGDMVDNVVEATGGDEKQAKQLRKEFSQGLKKAKSEFGVAEDSRRGSGFGLHGGRVAPLQPTSDTRYSGGLTDSHKARKKPSQPIAYEDKSQFDGYREERSQLSDSYRAREKASQPRGYGDDSQLESYRNRPSQPLGYDVTGGRYDNRPPSFDDHYSGQGIGELESDSEENLYR